MTHICYKMFSLAYVSVCGFNSRAVIMLNSITSAGKKTFNQCHGSFPKRK